MRLGFLKGLFALLISGGMITLACAETDISNMTAGLTGNYFGVQLGTTVVHAQDLFLPNSEGVYVNTRPSRKGFGTRFFWGYRFINYLALEGGYNYFSPATYNITNGNSPELRLSGVDIVGKGILPLFWGIDFYGKAGAIILHWVQGGLLAPNPQSSHDGANGITVRPEVALGFSYAFTPNWVVDISGTLITQGGKIPKTNFYAIGLSYRAVDIFCGQFLC